MMYNCAVMAGGGKDSLSYLMFLPPVRGLYPFQVNLWLNMSLRRSGVQRV